MKTLLLLYGIWRSVIVVQAVEFDNPDACQMILPKFRAAFLTDTLHADCVPKGETECVILLDGKCVNSVPKNR